MADLKGAPLAGPNSLNFMQFLGKFGKIVRWPSLGELALPPRGNPGSATENSTNKKIGILFMPQII